VLTHSLGGAIGLAAINAVLIVRTAVHQTQLAAGINLQRAVAPYDLGELSGAGETLESLQALRLLAETVKREATVLAFNDVIQFLALAVAVTLALLPFIRMPRPQAVPEPQPA
jgi:DHA2 family multidrug resistance protein